MHRRLSQGAFATVVEQRQAPWLKGDRADAQGIEIGGGDVGHVPFVAQPLGQLSSLVALLRRQVFDGDDRDTSTAGRLDSRLEPLAILGADRTIDLLARIPACIDGLHRHGRGNAWQFRLHLEAAIEEQLECGLAAMQLGEQAFQRQPLSVPLVFRDQLKAVEGIQKESGIAGLGQLGGPPEQMIPPDRRGQIHHLAPPGLVGHRTGAGTEASLLQRGGVSGELTDGQVGEGLCAGFPQGADIVSAGVPGFEDYPVELGQFGDRWFFRVPESHAGWRSQGRAHEGQIAQQPHCQLAPPTEAGHRPCCLA